MSSLMNEIELETYRSHRTRAVPTLLSFFSPFDQNLICLWSQSINLVSIHLYISIFIYLLLYATIKIVGLTFKILKMSLINKPIKV